MKAYGIFLVVINTGVNSPAIALSRLFSTTEYASRPMLLDLAKHHNVQIPSKYSKDLLGVLVTSHLG